MEVILSISGRGSAERIAKNVITSFLSVHPRSTPIEIEPIMIDGIEVRRFEAKIRRRSDVCLPADILCARFGYVSCIEWEQFLFASIPSDDEEGWEAKLADAVAVRTGFASGKYFRSFSRN